MECKKCGALGGPGRPFDRSRSWVACSELAALLMAKIHCFMAHQPKIPQGMDWCFFECSKVLKYSASFFKNSSVPFINHLSEWFKVSNHILPLLFIHQTTTINLSLVITSLLESLLGASSSTRPPNSAFDGVAETPSIESNSGKAIRALDRPNAIAILGNWRHVPRKKKESKN